MLKPIVIAPDIFTSRVSGELDRSRRALTWLMYGLSQINREYLLRYPNTPSLYTSGVRYRAEKNTENWQDIPSILRHGYGDCEDLACWRIGELQSQGIRAMPYISWRPSQRGTIYHALVRYPDGRIEDPSRALGMMGYFSTRPIIIGRVRNRRQSMRHQDMLGFSFKKLRKRFKKVRLSPKGLVKLAKFAGPAIASVYPPAGPAIASGMKLIQAAERGNSRARGMINSYRLAARRGNAQARNRYATLLASRQVMSSVRRRYRYR